MLYPRLQGAVFIFSFEQSHRDHGIEREVQIRGLLSDFLRLPGTCSGTTGSRSFVVLRGTPDSALGNLLSTTVSETLLTAPAVLSALQMADFPGKSPSRTRIISSFIFSLLQMQYGFLFTFDVLSFSITECSLFYSFCGDIVYHLIHHKHSFMTAYSCITS